MFGAKYCQNQLFDNYLLNANFRCMIKVKYEHLDLARIIAKISFLHIYILETFHSFLSGRHQESFFKDPLDSASTMIPFCDAKRSSKNVIVYISANLSKNVVAESLGFEVFESVFNFLLWSKIFKIFWMQVKNLKNKC